MNIEVFPSVARGEAYAPVSKSYAHRLLIAAALCEGRSVISGMGTNDDIEATIACLETMGAKISACGATVTVEGIRPSVRADSMSLFCNESGSTLRFLIPVSSLFAENILYTGAGRLIERPHTVYEELFPEMGATLKKADGALVFNGRLMSGVYRLRGDVSSQFITGLMFTLPFLDGDSEIVLTTPLQSAPYIDITIDVLSRFGVSIAATDSGWYIKGAQSCVPQSITCEGDWSNGAFLEAFNLAGGAVDVKGLNPQSCQGDKACIEYFKRLEGGSPTLDISDCVDLGPILIACAALKNGATLTGTDRLKVKESDRGTVMMQELLKFGVSIEIGNDYIKIPCCKLKAPTEPVDCHNDHRIAMSLAVLCSTTGGVLEGAQCVNKSYPDFFEDIRKIGIKLKNV